MTSRCPRTWEAEALEDGRLDGGDRQSFERHLTTCAECRRELASLASVRSAMGALANASPSELDLRRMREQAGRGVGCGRCIDDVAADGRLRPDLIVGEPDRATRHCW